MSSSKQLGLTQLIEHHKEQYMELILKQKTEALDRCKQQSQSLDTTNIHRYYAFVETLFVIDKNYFPPLSEIAYEDYVKVIVDTTNIVFQSENNLDIQIEVVISDIVFLNIAKAVRQEPPEYEPILRQNLPDYDKYDSIVLLWYQPWEGTTGAQGYAMVKGICNPQLKIMYLLPYQNAAFYLAHEIGHQLGLPHQVDTPCRTNYYMSVMTKAHTASFEQARWTKCENDMINSNICEFECLFNQPSGYQIVKNKFATKPGARMSNNQQAKMMEPNPNALGEVSAATFLPSESPSRCLYLRSSTGQPNGGYMISYSPMLPASVCGADSICHRDRCVPTKQLDPSLEQIEYETDILDLSKHCSVGNDQNALKASNTDPSTPVECINWENDVLCHESQQCPAKDDLSTGALYINHVCCQKCTSEFKQILGAFSHAELTRKYSCSVLFLSLMSFLCLI
ncbi:unnamed protein product [Adineta ricciae]|uniref:Peptidase M12B domain-containing protein n=1 Tax=Adineta ricciae TaxID=249248 RepID=A0A813S8D4_ADIRI|nr:unnamed protein product [Adineta ricciae]